MGKQSTRENKTIYQQYREEQGLTREKASQEMTGVSASRIEKIEYELQEPTPYDIIQMADCYKHPDLCNYYCSHKCMIGDRYVPEIEVSELSTIILETIASLNEINPLTSRLIQIARDGKITDDEIKDFARENRQYYFHLLTKPGTQPILHAFHHPKVMAIVEELLGPDLIINNACFCQCI